ncbi:MAG: diacylglycerol kinase family lipid kinase [Bacteroidota bacterium]|jgi:YegS/Rv2252/BmrU family lipid kinase|nr:diacylglycerol kinase family lipid kinase [Bacteroidota bacterium]
MGQKIAFVINPKAGIKKKLNISEFITLNFPKDISYDLIIWKDKNDFESIRQTLLNGNYTTVVACGGDGTVNEVASVIARSDMSLGIFPLGSGNGLARSNRIPLEPLKALKLIEQGKVSQIDGALINGKTFFCTAGIGFDAHIAHQFALSTKRGFLTYLSTTIKEFFSYKPQSYEVTIDGEKLNTKAFLITVANAGQWGNDVFIAPQAELSDGILNVSILKPFSYFSIPVLGYKLFSRKIHTCSHLISKHGKQIDIRFNGTLPVHFDGEPMTVSESISISIMPLALKIIC